MGTDRTSDSWLARAVVAFCDKARDVPDWSDEAAVHEYLESLEPEISEVIARIAQSAQSGKMIAADDIDGDIQREVESRGAYGINPIVIQVIVMVIMKIVERLIGKRSE